MRRFPLLRMALVAGFTAAAATASAQPLMFDANILWDNDAGSYSPDFSGPVTTTSIATVSYDNQTIDPLLNPQVYNYLNPRWDPRDGSPAIMGNPNARVVKASVIDPWFQEACFVGGVPYTGGVDSRDWTTGWTYYNYAGGSGRTDIDTTKTTVMVTTNITVNTTWTQNNNYVLVGRIGVNPPATLTIEPGTVIMGSGVGSYLVVERDANIDAQGTKAQPIIFTSSARWQDGDQAPGDWGGVVIHGKAVSNCVGGCGLTTGGDCVSEGGAGNHGGSDDNDSSGIIRYARVEYAGQTISPNNELNAWTFNSVGRNTTLEYMQGHLGLDDMFEWFGGTTRSRYWVATGGDDDNFDWQMGFRGYLQFAVCKQAPGNVVLNGDSGIEADNNEFNFNCAGRSNPVISNVTFVGVGPSTPTTQAEYGVRLRRGTAGTVINSIILGWTNYGLRIENTETFANGVTAQLPDLACAVLGVGDELPARDRNLIVRAAPNPTPGLASISFSLPRAQRVTVDVFTVTGRAVARVMDGPLAAGPQSVIWDPAGASPGLYFYRVRTEEGDGRGKLVVSR
jgi:hypothetical protein